MFSDHFVCDQKFEENENKAKYISISTIIAGLFLLSAVVLDIFFNGRKNFKVFVYPFLIIMSALFWMISGILTFVKL